MELIVYTRNSIVDFSIKNIESRTELEESYIIARHDLIQYKNFLHQIDSYIDDEIKTYAQAVSDGFSSTIVAILLSHNLEGEEKSADTDRELELKWMRDLGDGFDAIDCNREKISQAIKKNVEQNP